MSNASRIAILQARYEKVRAAIDGTLDRNAASYGDGVVNLASLSLSQLQAMERQILSEIARLRRGSFFGTAGFRGVQ